MSRIQKTVEIIAMTAFWALVAVAIAMAPRYT